MEDSQLHREDYLDDFDEIEARYEELSSKIDQGLNPFSFSELKFVKGLRFEDLRLEKDFSDEDKSMSRVLGIKSKSKSKSKSKELVKDVAGIGKVKEEGYWTDIITHVSVKDFLRQYFKDGVGILKKEFLGYLEFEFPNLVTSNEVKDRLRDLLSADKNSKFVSLNALEVATRDVGLELMVKNIAFDVEGKMIESKAVIHEEILKELTEAHEILECRKRDLDKREDALVDRETKVLRFENKFMVEFKEKTEKMAAEVKDKIAKEVGVQMKRLQGLERNVNEMIKMARTKQQTLTKSELGVKSNTVESASKLKSRISSLEKSNEVLKTKLSVLELELKTSKSTVQKLNEDLSRLRTRNSILEQTLISSTRRPDPEKPEKLEASNLFNKSGTLTAKQEPDKKPSIVNEPGIFINLISILLNYSKLSNPDSDSKRSLNQGLSIINENFHLIEVFSPAFNKLVPALIETFPFIHKHKNKKDLLQILNFFGILVIYAWSDGENRTEKTFGDCNLEFEASSTVWKQKIAAIKKGVKRKPVFPLFANHLVHKVLCFYLGKWMGFKGNKRISLISAFLMAFLAVSQKKVMKALEFIKGYLDEELVESDLGLYVHVLVTFIDAADDIGNLSCQILLSLTVEYLPQVISQCSREAIISKLSESCKKALISGQKLGPLTNYEESLIVLIQKLSSDDSIQSYLKSQNLIEILASRALSSKTEPFFKSKLSSIIQNLSN